MKIIATVILFFIAGLINAQTFTTLTVVEKDSNEPVTNAKIICDAEVFYTNDDGKVLVPSGCTKISASAISFDNATSNSLKPVLELSPKFQTIDEIIIKTTDAKAILEKVFKDYDKNYMIKPTVYRGIYKEKTIIDQAIHHLMIADINLWSKNNKFLYKKENFDSFVQMDLLKIRFLKNKKMEANYPFSRKGERKKAQAIAFVSRFFLYNQLWIIKTATKNAKINGKIISETGDEQEIDFKTEKMKGEISLFEGKIIYNKKDHAISYMKVTQIQPGVKDSFKNNFNESVETNTTGFTAVYDFLKENGKYISAKIEMDFVAELSYKGHLHPITSSEQFIFQNHQLSNN